MQIAACRWGKASISDVDFAALKAAGARGVILDKDNTITAPYADAAHSCAAEGLRRAVEVFGDRCVVLSNSVGEKRQRPQPTVSIEDST